MNNLEREYRDRVHSFFRPYSDEAVIALRTILSKSYAEDVAFLDFVMFAYDGFDDHMPIFTWPSTVENTVYTDIECPLAKIQTKPFKYYDEDIEDFVDIPWQLKDCAGRWLREAWKAAGGELFHLPCYFTDHDDLESFSFIDNAWCENDPKQKRKANKWEQATPRKPSD